MEIRDSEMSLEFFILYICKMKKIMKEKNQVVPDEVLSKEFISQFKTEADVSKFLKYLHVQVLSIYLHHFNLQTKCKEILDDIVKCEIFLFNPGKTVLDWKKLTQ